MIETTIYVVPGEASCLGRTTQPMSNALLYGLRAGAAAHGCHLLLSCAEELAEHPAYAGQADMTSASGYAWAGGRRRRHGLILVPPFAKHEQATLRSICERGHAAVATRRLDFAPAVVLDNTGGILQAFDHLFAHGHREIGFIAGFPPFEDYESTEQLNAYHAALRAHRISVDQRLIAYARHSAEQGYQATRQIILSGAPLSAVIVGDAEAAAGAWRALAEAGRRVPQDLALIVFDEQSTLQTQQSALTVVHSTEFERGYQAVALLLDNIAGRPIGTAARRIPTLLSVRQSCGCRPVHQVLSNDQIGGNCPSSRPSPALPLKRRR